MKATKSEQAQKFINCYNLLNIGQLDQEINNFVTRNFAFYTDPKKKSHRIDISSDTISIEDTSSKNKFSMTFKPSLVNPDSVLIELSNLGSNLEHIIMISFEDVGIGISVRRYYTSMSLNSKGTTKERTDTLYINGKKRFVKSQSYYVGKHPFEDSSYSRQEMTYTSAIDDTYVTSSKCIAEDRAYYRTGESYQRFDGRNITSISQTEFIETVDKFEREKKDIKQKKKNI